MVAVTEKSRRIAKRTKHASRLLRGLRVGGTSTTNLPNTVYTYDAGGRLTSEFDSATGITTKYTYKPDTNYVQTETVTDAAGTTLASYTYSYRNDGLKTGETDVTLNTDGTTYDTRTLSWTYDGLDRLTQEKSVESAQSVDLNYTGEVKRGRD